MKGLLALALGAAILSIVALALALAVSRDPVPGEVKACVREGGGTLVRGSEGLQPVRGDLLTRSLRERARFAVGSGSQALVLAGARARVLVLTGPGGPQLGGPEFLERLYADPSRYSVVAVEVDPRRGLLERCARAGGLVSCPWSRWRGSIGTRCSWTRSIRSARACSCWRACRSSGPTAPSPGSPGGRPTI